MPTSPLKTPAGYVPQMAVAIANLAGDADIVSAANPIPTIEQAFPAAPALTGTLAASGQVGPYAPRAGRAVVLSLAGTWTGTQLRKLVDARAADNSADAGNSHVVA